MTKTVQPKRRIKMSEKDMTSKITELLRSFQSSTPGVLGAGVISTDGFAIASELPQSVEERRVAAMAAAMLALGEQTTSEFEHGRLERVFVEGTDGYTVIMSAGAEAVLSVVARKDAKMGLVFLQMERTADALRKVMA
jgi:hypothetical protein